MYIIMSNIVQYRLLPFTVHVYLIMSNVIPSKYKKLLISKRRIGILKKLPKQGEDSKSL